MILVFKVILLNYVGDFYFFTFQARDIYEKAVEFFGEEYMEEKLFISFAQFEEAQKVVCRQSFHYF